MKPPGPVRAAQPQDVPDILRLIRELARYEGEPEAVQATESDLRAALFPAGREPAAFCHVGLTEHGAVVAIAVWFVTFSTWQGRHGIWLEDLYVEPAHRGRGLGRALLAELARTAAVRGYRRLELSVLDWNEPALGFYRRLGAHGLDEWTVQRIDGAALQHLAAGSG
jgi:GNAT superfamily N-acetyltransferase